MLPGESWNINAQNILESNSEAIFEQSYQINCAHRARLSLKSLQDKRQPRYRYPTKTIQYP